MKNIDGKAYLDSIEFRKKVKDSIKKYSNDLRNEINIEQKYMSNDNKIHA